MEECPVCYEDLILTKGGQCRHKVCVECLDNIKKNSGLCPLCREVWHYTVPRDSTYQYHLYLDAWLNQWTNMQELDERLSYREYYVHDSLRLFHGLQHEANQLTNNIDINSNSDTEMDQAERIRLVMEQTGSTREETIDALLQNSNDIFNAIMDLVIDAPFDLTS